MAGRRIFIASLICALALGENACSYPSQPGDPGTSRYVVSVQAVIVRPQVMHFLAIGETQQLAAAVFPANATDQAIAWESTDTTVATVDSVGRVTAKAIGSDVFITAYTHDGHHQSSANVTVEP
jgi:uncharacterized protein YjdB